jgi:hypothetical protein
MFLVGVVWKPCPSAWARNKSFRRLVICPGTKFVSATTGWPIGTVDDLVVHEYPALANGFGQVAVGVSVRRHWFQSGLACSAASYTTFPNT